jgi:hypothetical protein
MPRLYGLVLLLTLFAFVDNGAFLLWERARHAPANPRKASSDEPPVPFSNRLVVMARQFDVLQAVYAKALAAFKVSGSYGTSPNLVNSGEIKR